MKLISIIGTRPQYIKVKPIFDYCIKNNIDHSIADTNQHYSDSVSKNIIDSLNLKIDFNLNIKETNEIDFIASASKAVSLLLKKYNKKIFVLLYGDTNSAFAAALACYKMKIPFCHIEAGARCFNNLVPEEVNRIFLDTTSSLNFCTSKRDADNIDNGIICGDMEYELLNSMNISSKNISSGIMTIHRQANINKDKIENIFNFSSKIGDFILPIHHRLKMQKWFSEINIPSNIKVVDPLNFVDMAEHLISCDYIISDSGGLLKTSPFFGKKTLILRGEVGCIDVVNKGYGRICTFSDEDIIWLKKKDIKRVKRFFLPKKEDPSKVILDNILKYINFKD